MQDPKQEDAEKFEDVRNTERGLENDRQPIDVDDLVIPEEDDAFADSQSHDSEWER